MNTRTTCRTLAALLTAILTPGAFAQVAPPDTLATARQAALAAGPSIVTVELVVKMSVPDEEAGDEERKTEVTGTIIDPSGLTVTCLSSIDPSAIFGQLMGGDAPFQADVSDVKLRLADGTEVPAKVVLRDKDQDLAFIRPVKKPEKPLVAMDMKNGTSAQLLSPILLLGRMGKVTNRSLSARIDSIVGVMDKPRTRYILQPTTAMNELGSPALSLDGKVVGIVVLRVSRNSGDMSDMSDNIAAVIVPTEDILPVAAQAPENAPEPEKAAASPAAKKAETK